MTIRCSLGHENPDGATFCDECGEPLPAAPASAQEEEAPTLPAGAAPAEQAAPAAPQPAEAAIPQPAPAAPAAEIEATQPAPAAPAAEGEAAQPAPAAETAAPQPASAPPPAAEAPAATPGIPEAAPAAPEPVPAATPAAPEPAPAAAPQAAPMAAQPRLVVEGTTTSFDLVGKASVVVGREDAPSNSFPDIDLTPFGAEEGGVSRLHARLSQSGETWAIEDLESTNYTFVNRKRIAARTPTPLNDGDEIRLGRVGLRFKTTA